MIPLSYVNPVSELATAQVGYTQAQQDVTFGEQLVALSVFGYGDPVAARHQLYIAMNMAGNQQQNEVFWSEVIKQEKESFKRAWDLVAKD